MEPQPSLKQHHEKMSRVAKLVITLLGVTIILEIADNASTWLFRQKAMLDHGAIREAVSSVSGESRLTAKRLDEFIAESKKRWTFLRDENQGKILVRGLTAEEVDLQQSQISPTPTATIKPSPIKRRHIARPKPTRTPLFHWP